MIENPFLLMSAPVAFETTNFQIAATPPTNLTNDNMDMEWRSVGLADVYVVMRCAAPVDTIAILHSNQRATDTYRVRAAPTVAALLINPVYDSGLVPAYEGLKLEPYTTKSILDLGQPVQSLYWRFDFVSPGHPDGQVKAARIVMGQRFEIPTGINYGWEKLVLNDSPITTGPNYEDVDEYPSRPGVKSTLGGMDEATFNRLDALLMQAGSAKPVLYAPEPDNLDTAQHWTVYGRMKSWKFPNPYHNWWDVEVEVHGLRS